MLGEAYVPQSCSGIWLITPACKAVRCSSLPSAIYSFFTEHIPRDALSVANQIPELIHHDECQWPAHRALYAAEAVLAFHGYLRLVLDALIHCSVAGLVWRQQWAYSCTCRHASSCQRITPHHKSER